VDLAALARARLLAAGIAEVFVDGRDVFCLESAYSHRRQGAGAGRQVAAIVPRLLVDAGGLTIKNTRP
jgi:copper oxidase (laccase) domain-containing protein